MQLTTQTLYQLSGKAGCDVKTAKRWFDVTQRGRMKPLVRARVDRAAVELGITPPIQQQAEKA